MWAVPVGERAVLLECEDADGVAAAYSWLRESAPVPFTDLVPAARTVLLDGVPDVAATLAVLGDAEPPPAPSYDDGSLVELPVTYDGPDLGEVARQWDCTTSEVVATHTATEFRVAFCGFAPGFAYCTGLPAERAVARRAEPRARVEAGSVALAGEYTGVYPTASPGGWQVIGRTAVPLWRPDEEQPALLAPGTRVVFRVVDA